jgi:hypothetical protein
MMKPLAATGLRSRGVGAHANPEEAAMSGRPDYGDAEATRIIERAAEIDAEQGRRLDASALRAIAAEAGISPSAVDRALQEHEATGMTRVSWPRRYRTMLTLAAILLGLLLLALMRTVVPPHP